MTESGQAMKPLLPDVSAAMGRPRGRGSRSRAQRPSRRLGQAAPPKELVATWKQQHSLEKTNGVSESSEEKAKGILEPVLKESPKMVTNLEKLARKERPKWLDAAGHKSPDGVVENKSGLGEVSLSQPAKVVGQLEYCSSCSHLKRKSVAQHTCTQCQHKLCLTCAQYHIQRQTFGHHTFTPPLPEILETVGEKSVNSAACNEVTQTTDDIAKRQWEQTIKELEDKLASSVFQWMGQCLHIQNDISEIDRVDNSLAAMASSLQCKLEEIESLQKEVQKLKGVAEDKEALIQERISQSEQCLFGSGKGSFKELRTEGSRAKTSEEEIQKFIDRTNDIVQIQYTKPVYISGGLCISGSVGKIGLQQSTSPEIKVDVRPDRQLQSLKSLVSGSPAKIRNFFSRSRLAGTVRDNMGVQVDGLKDVVAVQDGSVLLVNSELSYLQRIDSWGNMIMTYRAGDGKKIRSASLRGSKLYIATEKNILKTTLDSGGSAVSLVRRNTSVRHIAGTPHNYFLALEGDHIVKYFMGREEGERVEEDMDSPMYITVESKNRCAVTEQGRTNTVTLYRDKMVPSIIIPGCGVEAYTRFRCPAGTAFTPWDTLLVADTLSNCVSEFTMKGDFVRHVVTCERPLGIAYVQPLLWVVQDQEPTRLCFYNI